MLSILALSRSLLLFTLVVVCLGCGSSHGGAASPTPRAATATPAADDTQTTIPVALANIYPELAAANLPVTESFSPVLLSKTPLSLYNFSGMTMQRLSIQNIYSLVFSIAQSSQAAPSFDANSDDSIVLQPRRLASIIMAFIPQDAPRPNWGLAGYIAANNPPAETTFTSGGSVYSYVRVEDGRFTDGSFSAPGDFATFNLSVEACQELVQVVVVDGSGVLVNDATLTSDAQEFICNSLGGAIASRALGISYADYETFVGSHPIRLSVGDAEPIDVDMDAYNSYPLTGPVLKQLP